MGHKAPDCWWPGPTYTIEQHAPLQHQLLSYRQTDNSMKGQHNYTTNHDHQRHVHLLSTTNDQPLATQDMGQATPDKLRRKCHVNSINGIYATLVLDDHYKHTDAIRQWAVLMDTGAIISVAPRHHFNHIPLQQLPAEDPQNPTSINGESTTNIWNNMTCDDDPQQPRNSYDFHHCGCEYSDTRFGYHH
eukprot:143100-Amphidinium_carterae.1